MLLLQTNCLPKKKPVGYWKNEATRKLFFEILAKQRNCTLEELGNSITQDKCVNLGARGLFEYHNGKIADAFEQLFGIKINKNKAFNDSLLQGKTNHKRPKGYWKDAKNRFFFLEYLAKKKHCSIEELARTLTIDELIREGGRGLLTHSQGKLSVAFEQLFGLKFSKIEHYKQTRNSTMSKPPVGYWKDASHRIEFFENLAKERGVSLETLANQLTVKQVETLGGGAILQYYKRNLKVMFEKLFGIRIDKIASYNKANSSSGDTLLLKPLGYWQDLNNQREAMKKFAASHGIINEDGWYNVTSKTFNKVYSFVNNYYNNSMYMALKTIFPEIEWKAHKFKTISRAVNKDELGLIQAMKEAEVKLGITKPDDWYMVNLGQLNKVE